MPKSGCPLTSDGIVIDVVAIGGRPLQTTLNEKKPARVHDRVMELLVDVQRRVFSTVNPSKIVELFKLGEGNPPTLGIKAVDVIDGFYSFLGFPRLFESVAIKKGIARGIQDGLFGYYSGASPVIGSDEKYQIPLVRVRFNASVTEDEIDLESGFLMMPPAVPVPTPVPVEPGGKPPPTAGGPDSPTQPIGPAPGILGYSSDLPAPGGRRTAKDG